MAVATLGSIQPNETQTGYPVAQPHWVGVAQLAADRIDRPLTIKGEGDQMRIYIRRYPRNRDYWEVCGGGKKVRVMSKTRAKEIAAARRRVRDKRKR